MPNNTSVPMVSPMRNHVPLNRVTIFFLAAFATVLLSETRADIVHVNMFRSGSSIQTGNGATLAPLGYFFSSNLFSSDPDEFTAVLMSFPGPGSPLGMTKTSPTVFTHQSGTFPTQAAMDAAYPFGTYAYAASGPGGPDSTSFVYAVDDYPLSVPYLTGTDFTDLQGLNKNNSFDFHFSPFVTGGQATESIMFFTVFDHTINSLVFTAGSLPATATGLTLPADTLQSGHVYSYELIFSNRDQVPSPGADFNAIVGFDFRTRGSFTTAIPEPGSFVPASLGALALSLILCLRVQKDRAKRVAEVTEHGTQHGGTQHGDTAL